MRGWNEYRYQQNKEQSEDEQVSHGRNKIRKNDTRLDVSLPTMIVTCKVTRCVRCIELFGGFGSSGFTWFVIFF